MIIFITHAEKSKINYDSLSNEGYVRRNTLSEFFINKYNKHLNTPEYILIPNKADNNACIQTVSMLAYELRLNVNNIYTDETDTNFYNIMSFVKKNINNDILICWNKEELVKLVEKMIFYFYNKKITLKWGRNPLTKEHNDSSTIWVIDPIKHTLNVYNQFDVIYNEKYKRLDVNYDSVKIDPILSINIKNTSYIQRIKSLFL
jgi:hypothetical protein